MVELGARQGLQSVQARCRLCCFPLQPASPKFASRKPCTSVYVTHSFQRRRKGEEVDRGGGNFYLQILLTSRRSLVVVAATGIPPGTAHDVV